MPLFDGITSFFSFLNDIVPFFTMYIDSFPGSATEIIATRIIMAAIEHLRDPEIY